MLIDLVNEVQSVAALGPETITAAGPGSAYDFSNCTAATGAILDVGAVSGTSPSLQVQIEESSDQVNWTPITGMVFNAVTAGPAHQVVRGLRGKQYVRANAISVTGTSPSFTVNVEIVAQKHQMQGAAAPAGGYDLYPATAV